MGQEKLYIEKELSWLAFNERVLQEAADKSNPLIERMRFLGIYSNNLDEFYKVRFAELKRRIIISEEQGSNSHSRHLLGKIQSRVLKADQEFDGLYNELLLEMARNQIFLINERQLSVNQQSWLRHYFKHYLRQHITPILINRETDLVQFLKMITPIWQWRLSAATLSTMRCWRYRPIKFHVSLICRRRRHAGASR
ncbi:polyphosphate kinase [Salmonella enterica subsp. arizonae]|uniref:Polyphosphate kinase n=1 Tax=Salmonella enterica subsp. arizonae TaxID=59203 RepID=A0A379RYY1_SALER|nr:polyphosphate kinase [Salmonella enterica subsp. arizonae]